MTRLGSGTLLVLAGGERGRVLRRMVTALMRLRCVSRRWQGSDSLTHHRRYALQQFCTITFLCYVGDFQNQYFHFVLLVFWPKWHSEIEIRHNIVSKGLTGKRRRSDFASFCPCPGWHRQPSIPTCENKLCKESVSLDGTRPSCQFVHITRQSITCPLCYDSNWLKTI